MSDEEEESYSKLRFEKNRKQRKAGGWQSMGLDHTIHKGIERKGFRNPTPIQRKTIPCILDGKDVVAMSRTGSGKTAAFVIPVLQRLKRRDTKGVRALFISPTRELALQTFQVAKELGRFTGLRCAVLVGGDAIEDQFSVIHESPDILIATPGRLLHIMVEMNLRLNFIQFVVFDEADRLFEMGFQDQLQETLKRIPESRQTLLFSATLPKVLVDFAKAGLVDPILVRLDLDEKISDRLSMVFAMCRTEEKIAVMLHLCRQLNAENNKTVVFCATMKHVEYVVGILNRAGINNTFLYSQLDATARKLNITRFAEGKNNILIVTDVAARGVDIPFLDTVINLHFPPKAKLFVHRVGRVARAGRTGTAISLIAADEQSYLTDLFLFLGKPMRFAQDSDKYDKNITLIGKTPASIVDLESEFLSSIHDNDEEMLELRKKANNAMMRFVQTRPPPSAESARRVKEDLRLQVLDCATHPFLRTTGDTHQHTILNKLASYRSPSTIFELKMGNKSHSAAIMKEKRRQHQERIRQVREEIQKKDALLSKRSCERSTENNVNEQAQETEISDVFTEVIRSAQSNHFKESKHANKIDKAEERRREKTNHFIPYSSEEQRCEKHLALEKLDFAKQADGATFELLADDDKGMYKQNGMKKWDRKRKRFVGISADAQNTKKIRTEDGTLLPASYKTGRYENWKKRQKIVYQKVDEDDSDRPKSALTRNKFKGKKWKSFGTKRPGGAKSELKNVDQIKKVRRKSAKLQSYMEYRRLENLKKRAGGTGNSTKRRGSRK